MMTTLPQQRKAVPGVLLSFLKLSGPMLEVLS
jgi:hypothetical protein